MATFVLVHGAWAGGWCWKYVVPFLRDAGHEVHAVTLTGLGERAHLLGPGVDLNTHVRDVAATIEYEDLENVILVGHSYGGIVITGVAGAIPESLAALVYVDSAVVADGQRMVDMLPAPTRDSLLQTSEVALPPPEIGDDMAWYRSKVTPHPIKSWCTPVDVGGDAAASIPRSYINCTLSGMNDEHAEALRRRDGWRVVDIETDHFPMVWMPERLAELLIDAVP
jgi:pimeloyl-ACP methyl ester carboxylesterase